MPFACIHTHTNFCDGSDDVETFCRSAHAKGLHSLGFSAHAPITGKTGIKSVWNLPEDRLTDYLESVQAAKKKWEGRLRIFLGLEVDFLENCMGPSDRDYADMRLDFIIGAVHFVVPPKGEPFTVDDSAETVLRGIKDGYGNDPQAMVMAYFEAEEAMIRSGGFDLLGHPDLVKKNNSGGLLFSEDSDHYRGRTASIAALSAAAGIHAEINTGGINRGKIKDCYPSFAFLKLFRKHGVPMVINADAHRAEDLDGHYDTARESLLAAGYTQTALFNGRESGRPCWTNINL